MGDSYLQIPLQPEFKHVTAAKTGNCSLHVDFTKIIYGCQIPASHHNITVRVYIRKSITMQKREKGSLVHTWIYSVSSLKSLTYSLQFLCPLHFSTRDLFPSPLSQGKGFFNQEQKCIEYFKLEKYFKLILMKTHFIVGTDRFVVLLFCCHGNQGAQKHWYSNGCHLWYLPSPQFPCLMEMVTSWGTLFLKNDITECEEEREGKQRTRWGTYLGTLRRPSLGYWQPYANPAL